MRMAKKNSEIMKRVVKLTMNQKEKVSKNKIQKNKNRRTLASNKKSEKYVALLRMYNTHLSEADGAPLFLFCLTLLLKPCFCLTLFPRF